MHNLGTPEFIALKEKVEAHDVAIAEMRGSLQQLEKIVTATARQSVWQLIALVITLSGVIVGGLAYQSSMLEKHFDQLERNSNQRFDAIEKRFDAIENRFEHSESNFSARFEQVEKNFNARLDQSERNINSRFEDLKQEVRASRK